MSEPEKRISPEEFIESISQNTERLMVAGTLAQLRVDPPESFYASQLSRALLSHVGTHIPQEVIRGLRDVGMIQEVGIVPPRRIVLERVDLPAWSIAQTAIRESGIVIPEFKEDLDELTRSYMSRLSPKAPYRDLNSKR